MKSVCFQIIHFTLYEERQITALVSIRSHMPIAEFICDLLMIGDEFSK